MVIDHATSPPPVAFVPNAPTPDVQPLPIEYQEHYKALKGPKQSKGEKKTTLRHKAPPQKKTKKTPRTKTTKQHTTLQTHNNASTRYNNARKRTAGTKVTRTILEDKKNKEEREENKINMAHAHYTTKKGEKYENDKKTKG